MTASTLEELEGLTAAPVSVEDNEAQAAAVPATTDAEASDRSAVMRANKIKNLTPYFGEGRKWEIKKTAKGTDGKKFTTSFGKETAVIYALVQTEGAIPEGFVDGEPVRLALGKRDTELAADEFSAVTNAADFFKKGGKRGPRKNTLEAKAAVRRAATDELFAEFDLA